MKPKQSSNMLSPDTEQSIKARKGWRCRNKAEISSSQSWAMLFYQSQTTDSRQETQWGRDRSTFNEKRFISPKTMWWLQRYIHLIKHPPWVWGKFSFPEVEKEPSLLSLWGDVSSPPPISIRLSGKKKRRKESTKIRNFWIIDTIGLL